MRSTLASLKSRPVLLVFLGLLFLELWGDFKGCSSMLSSFHTALGTTLFNGRIWALAGILACAILVAIWPQYFRKKRVLLVKLSTVLALLLTGGLLWGSWHGSFAPEEAAFAAVCHGIIYALLVISILASISDSEISFFGIVVAICAVLTVKTLLLFLLCALPGFLQAAMLLLLPCLSGGSLLTACATKAPSDIELAAPKESLPLPFLGLLLFAPMLNAVIRAFSSLGTWGVDTAFGFAMLPVGLGCVLLFILAVAVVFRQREQSDYVDCFSRQSGCCSLASFLPMAAFSKACPCPRWSLLPSWTGLSCSPVSHFG